MTKWVYIILITLFGLWGMRALFHPGFYTSLDGWHNIARLYHFDKIISQGIFPPRWSTELANGYGYPLFVFSYHTPWLIAEPFIKLGVGIIDGVKLVEILGFVLSGIFMFLFVKDIAGEKAGLISGIIYMWTPYRFAKILVGASVGEATVFMFLPLLFWSLYKVSKTGSKRFLVLGSVSFAALVMSHLMIIPLLSFLLVFYLIYLLRETKDRKKFVFNVFLLFTLGIGLSAYYSIPVFRYSSIIKAKTDTGFADMYKNHFVNLSQLIYSPWGYGPIINNAKEGSISFQAGVAQWLAVAITFLWLCLSLFKVKLKNVFNNSNKLLVFFLLLSFALSVFLMTDYSYPVWKLAKNIFNIDYPWRFLTVTTFTGSVLAGLTVCLFKKYRNFLIVLFIIIALYTNKNHVRVNQYTDVPLSLYIASETTTNTFSEYLPKWSEVNIGQQPKGIIGENNDITSREIKVNTNSMESQINAIRETKMTINQLYFPGMEVYRDNKKMQFNYDGDGRISLKVPQGIQIIKIIFERSPLMKISELISLFSLILLICLSLCNWQKIRAKVHPPLSS